jgi:S1-C subfamily serine protease
VRGELIGLNVALLPEGQGIGFAVPIKLVAQALAEIFTPEGLRSLWFGAQVKAGFGPLTVVAVEPDSPAHQAGLRAGDVIVQLNGRPPRNFIEFNQELIAGGEGKTHSLAIHRGGQQRTITVRLVPESSFFNAGLIRRKLGAELQEMTAELAGHLNLPWTYGFILTEVDREGPAAAARLQPGLVVRRIEGKPVKDLVHAARLIHGRKKGEPVQFEILVRQQQGNVVHQQLVTVPVAMR